MPYIRDYITLTKYQKMIINDSSFSDKRCAETAEELLIYKQT